MPPSCWLRSEPVLAFWGSWENHDVSTDPAHVTAVLQSHGISVLRNRSVPLERDGGRLWLAGLDDVLEGKPDLKLTLKAVPPAELVVLLADEPDFADYVAQSALTCSSPATPTAGRYAFR